MELIGVLDEIKNEIDGDDKIRERVLQLSRSAVRKCSESIKLTHRGEFDASTEAIRKAHEHVIEASKELAKSAFLSRGKTLDVAYQELAEATNLHSLLEKGVHTPPGEYNIPSRPYLNGLADVIGELRRATLDALRNNEVQRGVEILEWMETILDELQTFDYPNALVPDLRRKCDVGRALVERTRGDVTRAVGDARLIDELRLRE
ncbi:MAG: haloacid dehalogenase [Candidatus Thorarchaeota archaeon]